MGFCQAGVLPGINFCYTWFVYMSFTHYLGFFKEGEYYERGAEKGPL